MAYAAPSPTSARDDDKLNFYQKASVWSNQFYQGIQITTPYILSVFVVRHFRKSQEDSAANERTIGQLTGALAGSFSAAQFCTAYLWGVASDKLGRKPVILISNVITAIAGVCFGLSPSLEAAMAARVLGGLFNGSGVAIKTLLAESCKPTEQAKGMALLSLGWGMGSTLGPMLGGSLAQPCDRFPNSFLCHDGSIFIARPFLLPSLFIGLVGCFATYTNTCWLAESNPKILAKKAQQSPDKPAWRKLKGTVSNLASLLSSSNRYSRLTSDEVELGKAPPSQDASVSFPDAHDNSGSITAGRPAQQDLPAFGLPSRHHDLGTSPFQLEDSSPARTHTGGSWHENDSDDLKISFEEISLEDLDNKENRTVSAPGKHAGFDLLHHVASLEVSPVVQARAPRQSGCCA